MANWLLIYVLPGAVLFGGSAWAWRRKPHRPRVHVVLALFLAFVAWFLSMLFGWFLFLDVLHAGPLGRAIGAGVAWSLAPAVLTYMVLRRESQEKPQASTSSFAG